ncbi:MAG: hypothetical protein GVY06_00200 [Alphaproteobacteria bacterium]|jgi:LPS-assembly lipoprotein|nr:hypothetical protein [Alphaproteobacteria bacterium]
MIRSLRYALPALLLALGACGFQPVYGTNLGAGDGNVRIEQIQGRTGHALRKALLRETAAGIPGAGGPTVIRVELDETIKRLGFRPDGAASRSSVNLRAKYVAEFPDNAVSGRAETEVFFNVPREVFGDVAAQNNAAERAATDLARRINDDIRLRLADRG